MKNEWLYFTGKNVPSSKNSKQWTGKMLIKSKLCQEYEKWLRPLMQERMGEWEKQLPSDGSKPLEVEFYFYRDTRRKFDYINSLQIIADLMVSEGYIHDDNAYEFKPVFAGFEVVDKGNSGFKMRIMNKYAHKNTK